MPEPTTRDLVATYLRPHRPRLVLLAVLFSAGIGLQLLNPLLAKAFIDRAAGGAAFGDLLRLAAAFLLVALTTQVAVVAEVAVAEDLGWRTTNVLRLDLTAHVLGLDERFHADHGPGALLERIDGDVAAIAGFFGRFIVHVLGSAVFLLGVLVLLWREDWRLGAVLSAFAAGAVVYVTKGGGFVGRRSRLSRAVNADVSDYLEERLSALPDIKANGGDDATMRGLHLLMARRFRVDREALLAASLFSGAAQTVLAAATVAGLVTAAWLHQRDVLTLGGVYLVFRYTGMLRMPLERLARHMSSFQRAMGGIVRVRELLATERTVTDGGGSLRPGALAVELRDVGFAYGEEPVLRGVSLRLEPGRTLGVLGRTGSGKTTLARLLFRLYDVDTGTVEVGGTDVRALRVDVLQRQIALVTQDVQLLTGTLRDNVGLFDREVDDDRITAAFTTLGLDDWLAGLPSGLDTEIGTSARGVSAGEAQLIALARAFLRDPGVVILDEASSRLDPHTERALERAVDRLLEGRTGVVIAHRLRTLERADEVVVLEAGAVVEHGDRAALAADPGSRFARLLAAAQGEVPA